MTDYKVDDYKKMNRVNEGPGRWNFKGLYTPPNELTPEQKKLELYKALANRIEGGYKEHAEMISLKPFVLTDEQKKGKFSILERIVDINAYPLDFKGGQMTARKTREFFIMKKKLEEKINGKFYRSSISLNQKIIANPLLIMKDMPLFALRSSASYITIKIDRKEHSGIFIPYDGIDTMIYQFNNLASEKVLASGVMRAIPRDKEEPNSVPLEVEMIEVRHFFS
ncbi:hypothetical protein HYX11_00940 [Candidatus Woesearchaeota archaeon]|nr:hypothetical protein [Candidatus Woesearchaeota archaeon]